MLIPFGMTILLKPITCASLFRADVSGGEVRSISLGLSFGNYDSAVGEVKYTETTHAGAFTLLST